MSPGNTGQLNDIGTGPFEEMLCNSVSRSEVTGTRGLNFVLKLFFMKGNFVTA